MKLATKLFLIENSIYTQLCKKQTYTVGIKVDDIIFDGVGDLDEINTLIECPIETICTKLSDFMLARNSYRHMSNACRRDTSGRRFVISWSNVDTVNLAGNIVNSRLNGEDITAISNEETSASLFIDTDAFRKVLSAYIYMLGCGYLPEDSVIDSMSQALADVVLVIYLYDLLNSEKYGMVLRDIITSEVANLKDISVINKYLNVSRLIENTVDADELEIISKLDDKHQYIKHLPYIDHTDHVQANLSLINLVQINAI